MRLSPNGKRLGRPPTRPQIQKAKQMSEEGMRQAVTETPEFKAAVDAAVAAALANFTAPPQAPATDGGAYQMMDRLAVSIARMSGQGVGQSYVDPEILARRKDAHRRMRELLADLSRQGDKPKWQLVGPIHMPLGDMGYAVIQPFYRDAAKKQHLTEISHFAEPNLAMRPLNRAAERVWTLFCESIGHGADGEANDEDGDATDGLGGKLGPLGDIALSWSGNVIQGSAAAVQRRQDPNAVTIEHGDDPKKRRVQIFTTMPAVEMG